MKYDPARQLNSASSFMDFMMQPFEYRTPEEFGPNWDMIDAVTECMSKLSEHDQHVLEQIFYDRNTYEKAAQNLNVKAKSHVWRKTKIALKRLEAELLKHPMFQNKERTDNV